MMKRIGLLAVIICVVILAACDKSEPNKIDTAVNATISDIPKVWI